MDTLPVADWGWLFMGLLMTLAGGWLMRWSSRSSPEGELAEAKREAAARALTGSGNPADARAKKSERRAASSRQDIWRFVGVVGFILLISGLLLAILGLFGTVD